MHKKYTLELDILLLSLVRVQQNNIIDVLQAGIVIIK